MPITARMETTAPHRRNQARRRGLLTLARASSRWRVESAWAGQRRAGSATAVSSSGPPSRFHVACQRIAQCLGMPGVRVDLILRVIEPEADGTVSLAAIKVIGEQGLYLRGHRCPVSLTDLVHSVGSASSQDRSCFDVLSVAVQGFGSISGPGMSGTGRTVPEMNEPLSRYDVTVTAGCDGGSRPGPAAFTAAAEDAARGRSASIISAHLADKVIGIVTVTAPDRSAAVAVARAAVSGAAQRRSIEALKAQLSSLEEQLAVLEQILGPLMEWSRTWAEMEERLLNISRGPAAESPDNL
jgi:hypothetical protein